MIDVKNMKKFLKRSPAPKHIVREDFFIGATVLLFARELVVVDYGDGTTRTKLHHQSQQSLMILPGENQANWGKIIESIMAAGLLLVRAKTVIIPSGRRAHIYVCVGGSSVSCVLRWRSWLTLTP